MIDLKGKPFYLSDEDIKWVYDTYENMTFDERVGQLFINLTLHRDENYLKDLCNKYHIGGVRWQGGTLEEIYHQNRIFQENSKVPVLIASNCEAGGNGAVKEGTLVGTGAACGADQTSFSVHQMAEVSSVEASAIGCNWIFAPIVDLVTNAKNTIVNFRAFGSDPDLVIERSLEYMNTCAKHDIACCAKHFPGDGSEERDQHLVMGCNDLSVKQWDETFGKVYKTLIDNGLKSIMVGHIALREYSKHLRPGMQDQDIKPATLAPELLNDLLREKLGYNGLLLTDASHMVGLTAAAPRSEVVPGVIAAGCDMILFFNDVEEDIGYLKKGIQEGIVTEERLKEANLRILALKASIGLHKKPFPSIEGLKVVGCEKHKQIAREVADKSITIVKDTQNLLPINPQEKPNVLLYFLQQTPVNRNYQIDPAKKKIIARLEKEGFKVTAPLDWYEMQLEDGDETAPYKMIAAKEPMSKVKEKYDFVLVVTNMKGYAQTNNVRINYSIGHSQENPWYVKELPTVCASLSYTNHLFDLPMMKTFINAYCDSDEYIDALVEKLVGKSAFKGKADKNVFCDRWEAKL